MIVEIILIIIFSLIVAGDCYSTAKLMKHNHLLITDKKYARRVRYRITKKLKEDETKAEMSNLGRRLMKKYGPDRTMLYIGIFVYGPLSLVLLYELLTGGIFSIIGVIFLIGLILGILYKQIWQAATIRKRFGVDVWTGEIEK